MIGDSYPATAEELTQVLLNRHMGVAIVYGTTEDGGSFTVHYDYGSSNTTSLPQPLYPWEKRLLALEALIRETIALFGRFSTGRVPCKGYGGLQLGPRPPLQLTPPIRRSVTLDLRRHIRNIMTPRLCLVP